jgi:hypothetical protein
MPRVGLETTITVFERAKTVHALDRATILNTYLSDRICMVGFLRCNTAYYCSKIQASRYCMCSGLVGCQLLTWAPNG